MTRLSARMQTTTNTEPLALSLTMLEEPTGQPTAQGYPTVSAAAERIVDEALIESFPASDPPSWWAGA